MRGTPDTRRLTLALLPALLFCAAMRSPAQSTQPLSVQAPSTGTAAFFSISKPGELTIQVNLWGAVRNAGRYEVPGSTDLVQLISYAGGPASDADLDDVQIVRAAGEGGAQRVTTVVNLDELATVAPADLLLRPGDTIYVGHSSWSSVRDALTVITTVAIVVTATSYVIIATND